MLEWKKSGIEVAFGACQVLAHLVADEAYTYSRFPSRRNVHDKMCHAIKHWKLKTRRAIMYPTFAPILNLLIKFKTPTAQYWATWELCNLTKMNSKWFY